MEINSLVFSVCIRHPLTSTPNQQPTNQHPHHTTRAA
jgi:hypothetical protein